MRLVLGCDLHTGKYGYALVKKWMSRCSTLRRRVEGVELLLGENSVSHVEQHLRVDVSHRFVVNL